MKSDIMVSSLVFCSTDIGGNFRLLRIARRMAMRPGSNVILIGPDVSNVPKEIEKLKNVSIRHLQTFSFPFFLAPLLFPLKLFIRLLEFIVIRVTIYHVDQVICSTNPVITEPIVGWILARTLGAKLLFDVSPFQYTRQSSGTMMYFEQRITALADLRLVPTKAMKIVLSLQSIDSQILPDMPGTLYHNQGNRADVLDILDIAPTTIIIGLSLPIFNTAELDTVVHIFQSLDVDSDVCLLVFGGSKCSKAITSRLTNKPHITMKFVPINSTLYASALAACDCAIILHGSRYGLDISPQLTEAIATATPVLVHRFGCISEVVTDGVNGFIFRDTKELTSLLQRVANNTLDIRAMKHAITAPDIPALWDAVL